MTDWGPACVSQEAWDAFLEVRKRKGRHAPITDYALRRICAKLQQWHDQGWDAEHILAETVEHGWTSVYLGRDTPRRQLTQAEQERAELVRKLVQSTVSVTSDAPDWARSEEQRRRVMAAVKARQG